MKEAKFHYHPFSKMFVNFQIGQHQVVRESKRVRTEAANEKVENSKVYLFHCFELLKTIL